MRLGGLLRIGLAAALAAAALPGCGERPPATARTASPTAPSDTLGALDPFLAYRRALALGEQQRFNESLPYFRHSLAFPTDAWQPHCDYAISLFHAVLETDTLRGFGRPVVRSSYERALMMRESFVQLDRAESLATTPEGRAFVTARRARHLAAFRFSWDASSEYLRAARTNPSDKDAPRRAAELIEAMRDPVRAPAPPIAP